MATIREVAQRAGVSPTTVSHVINQTRYVSEEVTVRVHMAMQELGYRPNALARSLRCGETKTIGLILPDSSNPYFAELGHAIESQVFSYGYSLILCNSEGDQKKETFYTQVLMEKQVDGIMFISSGDEGSSIQSLLDHQVPLVVIDRICGALDIDVVLTDNFQGGYAAGSYLAGLAHTRIGMITGPIRVTPSAERGTGFQQALADHGIEVEKGLIVRGAFNAASGYQAAEKLLSINEPPTAIFASNDLMAIGTLRAAYEHGLSVPQDLSLIGFDDIELASYVVPPLTTIAQPKEQIGQAAVDLLIKRITDPVRETERVVLQNSLVLRNSCRRFFS
ncbi:MAG: LacI family DNA-binding transcriptional regulator [Anaerolineales bacterium]|nr:LacI family DNA-binding transcriptional regulator [Anaerolineales bacterium]